MPRFTRRDWVLCFLLAIGNACALVIYQNAKDLTKEAEA